jgi:hypothetical protein
MSMYGNPNGNRRRPLEWLLAPVRRDLTTLLHQVTGGRGIVATIAVAVAGVGGMFGLYKTPDTPIGETLIKRPVYVAQEWTNAQTRAAGSTVRSMVVETLVEVRSDNRAWRREHPHQPWVLSRAADGMFVANRVLENGVTQPAKRIGDRVTTASVLPAPTRDLSTAAGLAAMVAGLEIATAASVGVVRGVRSIVPAVDGFTQEVLTQLEEVPEQWRQTSRLALQDMVRKKPLRVIDVDQFVTGPDASTVRIRNNTPVVGEVLVTAIAENGVRVTGVATLRPHERARVMLDVEAGSDGVELTGALQLRHVDLWADNRPVAAFSFDNGRVSKVVVEPGKTVFDIANSPQAENAASAATVPEL